MRIEPAPSVASAAAAKPAATAAADPPLEPPGERPVSHGLRVTPQVADSVKGHCISSGTCVLPSTIAPAARSRATTSASAASGSLIGLRERALGEDDADRVELRIDPRHPLEVELHQLTRSGLAGAHELGLAGESGEGEISVIHGGAAYPAPGVRPLPAVRTR